MSSRFHPCGRSGGGHDLIELIRSNAWMMRILRAVRDEQIPDAWIGAGALRDLVWGERYGAGFSPDEVRDVDVAFFEPDDLSRANDDRVTQRLLLRLPDIPWEAKNQAAVHTWYPAKFGGAAVEPLTSIHNAVSTWPETATAVAVRLGVDDVIEVCAPLGVDDLLDGVWRRNPRRVDVQRSVARLARHQPATRWPGVSVIPPAPATFPGRTLALVGALVTALAVAFVVAPPWLAASGAAGDLADRGRLGAAFRSAVVGYWRSGDRDYPPDLQRVVDYWFRFHLVKGGIAALLLIVLGVLTVVLWRSFLLAGGLRTGSAGTTAALLTLFALVLMMANIQGALAPLASLLPILTDGTTDASVVETLAQARQQLNGSHRAAGYNPPALDAMVSDFGWYHSVLAVIAAVVLVALLGLSAMSWRGFARVGSADRRARRVWGCFGVGSALFALIIAVVLVANAGTARDPAPAMLDLFNGGF